MELRDFFTDTEIRVMKERIIKETCLATFITSTEHTYEDGEKVKYNRITPMIEEIIREETVKQVKAYVQEIVNTVAKERVAAAVDNFSKRLCEQLEKIADKTNWYWSIK
jgi:hypothetical protein